MSNTVSRVVSSRLAQVRALFIDRDFIFHDGRALRRFSLSASTQMVFAGAAAVSLLFSAYGVAQVAGDAVDATGIAGEPATAEAKLLNMRAQMLAMQADVAATKLAAKVHVARFEQRQALIAAVLTGKGDPAKLVAEVPNVSVSSGAAAAEIASQFRDVEAKQVAAAAQARRTIALRASLTEQHLRRLGVARTVTGGMGGPFEPLTPAAAAAVTASSTEAAADAQFRALFQTWKKLDSLEQAVISIPSAQPVQSLQFTSNFGVRSDPFRGVAAMHAGVDIPGPIGTPIYATADGIVARTGRVGGYGNLVELNHGKGIETRYGHLSRILVEPNTRVHRGQLIALMGSTGRSTGSHLHYEVRIDGHAVNPIPYLQTTDTLLAIQDRTAKLDQGGVGGPLARRR